MIPVLEVGGTHVSAALVGPDHWTVTGAVRLPLDADAPADDEGAKRIPTPQRSRLRHPSSIRECGAPVMSHVVTG